MTEQGIFSPEILSQLKDYKIARITFFSKREGEFGLDCVVRSSTSHYLEARFLPDQLPGRALEPDDKCHIACDIGMTVLSLQARVDQVIDGRRLRLVPEQTSAHDDTRKHFRVEAEVLLRYWPAGRERPEEAVAEVVNISGSGIRFTTDRPLKLGQRVKLEITLPGPVPSLVCFVAKVQNLSSAEGGGQMAALEIIEISTVHLDRIVEFCLGKKFREMKNKVQFLGSVLSP